ncbi:GlxA family transcriptional regulator [Devosia sp.]|uniref:GlxA family transcriptional regulator n=1 Tax=Devosia sp. TaxID=1871048 RepID=UPI003A930B48
MTGPARRIPTLVVLPAHTLLLDVAGPVEALRKANQLQGALRYDVSFVSPLPQVTSSVGLRLADLSPLPETVKPGTMIVVCGDTKDILGHEADGDIEAWHTGDDAIVAWLRRVVAPGIRLVTICAGARLAARAGLLDGHACTTHFSDCAELAEIAPTARVLENRLYVEDGERFSSAGITAGIDLMLHIIAKDAGPATAAAVARFLVVYLRRAGSDPQLSPWLTGRNHIHPAIHRTQDAITADPAHDWSLDELARIAVTSPRHLSRLFNEHVGMSLPDYVNRLRVALAAELLVGSRADMERVAEQSGFNSARQLRRAWTRIHPTPPSAARRAAAH